MPFCPKCRSEYRSGIATCAHCEVPLVESLDALCKGMDESSMEEYLSDKELVIIARSNLVTLKRIKTLLCENNIANLLLREDACGCGPGGCGGPTLSLAVAEQDLPRIAEVWHSDFQDLVQTVEGSADSSPEAVVDLGAEETVCPACGTKFSGKSAECPECGLFFGVSDD